MGEVIWTDPDGKRYKRVGECLRCGECCKTLVISMANPDITEFHRLHLGGIVLQKEDGTCRLYLQATCQALHQGVCLIYKDRPRYCRDYPQFPSPNIRCGYKFVLVEDEEA